MENELIYVVLMALVLLVPGGAFTMVSGQDAAEDNRVFVVTDITQEIPLKAIQQSDGDVDKQNDFEIEPEDVVQTSENYLTIFSTDGPIEKVKVVDQNLKTTELANAGDGQYGIQNLAAGGYLLDVVVQIGDEKLGYQTVLVVLEPGQGKLNNDQTNDVIEIFMIIIIDIDIDIIFNGNNTGNKTKPPVGNQTGNQTLPPPVNNTILPGPGPNMTTGFSGPVTSGGGANATDPFEDPPECPEMTEAEFSDVQCPPTAAAEEPEPVDPTLAYDPNCIGTAEMSCLDEQQEEIIEEEEEPVIEEEERGDPEPSSTEVDEADEDDPEPSQEEGESEGSNFGP